MINDIYAHKNRSIEKGVAKLYLYFLPFKMLSIFSGINSIFIGLANRTSFIFLVLGLMLMISTGKLILPGRTGERLYKNFTLMYLICDFTSIVMATVLYNSLGTIGGENTFNAIIPKILYSIAYMVFIIYNVQVFRLISKQELSEIIEKIISICIFIGFMQIAVIFVGGPFSSANDFVSKVFDSWSTYNISYTKRIALVTSEPATIAGFIGVFIIPYIFSKWIEEGFTRKRFIKFAMILIILYFTKSTTGYALFAIDFIMFGLIYLRNSKKNGSVKILFIISMTLAAIVFVSITLRETLLSENIYTVLIDKLFNRDNTSTATRKVPLYVNWGAFKEHPLLGVGNGVQGFYYTKYFPSWAHNSIWAQANYTRSSTTLFDGALFFPSFLSGYGILGITMLLILIAQMIKKIKMVRDSLGYLYSMFIMAGIGIIVYGFSSNFSGEYWVWFIISIPFAASYINDCEDAGKEVNRL